MTYKEALNLTIGAKVRTCNGDVGVIDAMWDSGLSIHLHIWTGSRVIEVHSANCWPVND